MMNTVASLIASFVAGIAGAPQVVVDSAPFRDQPPAEAVRPAEPVDFVIDAPSAQVRAVSLRELAGARIVGEGAANEGPISSRAVSLAALHAVRLVETVSDAPPFAPTVEAARTSWNVALLDGTIVTAP